MIPNIEHEYFGISSFLTKYNAQIISHRNSLSSRHWFLENMIRKNCIMWVCLKYIYCRFYGFFIRRWKSSEGIIKFWKIFDMHRVYLTNRFKESSIFFFCRKWSVCLLFTSIISSLDIIEILRIFFWHFIVGLHLPTVLHRIADGKWEKCREIHVIGSGVLLCSTFQIRVESDSGCDFRWLLLLWFLSLRRMKQSRSSRFWSSHRKIDIRCMSIVYQNNMECKKNPTGWGGI